MRYIQRKKLYKLTKILKISSIDDENESVVVKVKEAGL
jgi:hypothetical protein